MSICAICDHPHRVEIEQDLTEYRTSGRTLLSQRYGVSQSDLALHWGHFREALAETRESVLQRVQRTERMCEALVERAVQPDDEGRVKVMQAAAALRELRGAQQLLIAMLPRQQGELPGSETDLRVIIQAELRGNPALVRQMLAMLPREELKQLVEAQAEEVRGERK